MLRKTPCVVGRTLNVSPSTPKIQAAWCDGRHYRNFSLTHPPSQLSRGLKELLYLSGYPVGADELAQQVRIVPSNDHLLRALGQCHIKHGSNKKSSAAEHDRVGY